jgi:protein TonB
MLRYNISFPASREAQRLLGAPLTAAGTVRWPGAVRTTRPPLTPIGAAVLLHGVAFGLALSFVRVPQPSPPLEPTITLVFEAPKAPPAAAPEPVAPPEASPAPPPQTAAPPLAAPPPEQPPPPQAAVPAPEQPPPEPSPVEPPPPPVEQAPPQAKPAEPPRPRAVQRPAVRTRPAAPARIAEPPAAAATEAPPSARPAQTAAEAPISTDWQHSLAAWLAAHKTYPELARRRGIEGSVVLRFTAGRSGQVVSVSVVRSAGSPMLDSAAEALVRDATLPPFPAAMPQQTATVTVTLHYTLTN